VNDGKPGGLKQDGGRTAAAIATTGNGNGRASNGNRKSRASNGNGHRAAVANGNGHSNGAAVANGNGHSNGARTATARALKTAPAAGHSRVSIPLGPIRVTAPPLRDAVFRRLLAVADLAAAFGGLATVAAWTGHGIALASIVTVPLIVALAKLSGRYDHDEVVLRKSTLDEAPALLMLAAAYCLSWSMVAFLTGLKLDLGGGGVVILWASTATLLVILRSAARSLAQRSAPAERVLIIGDSVARTRLAQSLACDPGAHIEVVGFLPLEDERRVHADWGSDSRRKRRLAFEDLSRVVEEFGVHRVFLIPTTADSETMLDAVSRTTALGVKVSIVPRLLEVVGSAVEFDTIGGVTVLGVRRPGLSRSSRAIKRSMDLVGSALGLLLVSPFLLAAAVMIKLDSPGPVFFRQLRVGRDGRTFKMFKFRSMVDGAEAQRTALEALNETDGLFKLSSDPRVTRVGQLLRKSSIDELPQLINVLLGDMSLVGPRPLVVDEDRLIEGRHRDRLQLPPGMTGPWQVLGPSRPPLSEMVKTDYLYAANWSLWTDIKILLRTFGHVVGQRGM
jgi:exopolysaccharide biosynthesis polyprenyl glycosylphosphotransferase